MPASKKILFFPLSYVLAHLSRCLQIGVALRAKGHEVVFAGELPNRPRSTMNLVHSAGFRHVVAREFDHPYAWNRFMRHGWPAALYDFSNPRRWVPMDELIDDHIRIVERERPDVIVGDATFTIGAVSLVTGVPSVSVFNAYFLDFFHARLAMRMYWRGYDGYHFAPLRKRVYRKYGVRPVDSLELAQKTPVISPDLPEFYTPSAYLSEVHSVGPIFFEYPAPMPAWLDELDDGKPNVYITMGSTGRFDRFLQSIYPHFARLPYRFVVTTGGQVQPDTIRNAPPNFRITDFAPGSAILKRCRAMIFHGGNSTMYQALAAGVPMIALPTHFEQSLNTRNAVRQGFCIRASLRRSLGRRLVELLEATTADDSGYRARAAALRYAANRDGAVAAADIVSRLGESPRTVDKSIALPIAK